MILLLLFIIRKRFKTMRVKNSIINIIYIWGSSIVLLLMNFVVRRIFLDNLSLDYLGYDGLFVSIFSFLTLSEMGIAGIITYHMYSEIATNNIDQIRKLLYMYKTIYKVVGFFVLGAGALVTPFIPLILKNSDVQDSWGFIFLIYFLQLMATLCTYFLAYRRILYVTYQKVYFTTLVDTIGSLVSTVLKIVVLVFFRNYILYLLIAIANNICTNAVISYKSKKDFPEVTKVPVTKKDFQDLGLWADVKNMMATKIAGTIYGSSDSIITTWFLGTGMVALVNNYQMISSKLQEFILTLFKALQASIGSLVYDKDKEKGLSFLYALDLVGFYLGYVAALGMVTVGQSFIIFWLKKADYQLPFSFLFLLSLNVFISICNNPMNYFRNTLGHFEADRNYMIAAAVVNVVLTLIFTPMFGITGVMIGTVIGHLLMFLGRTVVVYKFYVKASPVKYCFSFLFRLCLFVGSTALLCYIGNYLPLGFIGIIIRGLLAVVFATIVFFLYGLCNPHFGTIKKYINTVFGMVLRKKKKGNN